VLLISLAVLRSSSLSQQNPVLGTNKEDEIKQAKKSIAQTEAGKKLPSKPTRQQIRSLKRMLNSHKVKLPVEKREAIQKKLSKVAKRLLHIQIDASLCY